MKVRWVRKGRVRSLPEYQGVRILNYESVPAGICMTEVRRPGQLRKHYYFVGNKQVPTLTDAIAKAFPEGVPVC